MSKKKYDNDELKDALKRAFIDNKADKIIIDNNLSGQRFLLAAIELGLRENLIWQSNSAQDEQTAVHVFRPTKKLFLKLGGMSKDEAIGREMLGRILAKRQEPGRERSMTR